MAFTLVQALATVLILQLHSAWAIQSCTDGHITYQVEWKRISFIKKDEDQNKLGIIMKREEPIDT